MTRQLALEKGAFVWFPHRYMLLWREEYFHPVWMELIKSIMETLMMFYRMHVDGWLMDASSTVCAKSERAPQNKILNKTNILKTTDLVGMKRPNFLRKEWHICCFSETVILLVKGFLKRSKQEDQRPNKSTVVGSVGLGDYQEHPRRPAAGSDNCCWRLQILTLVAQMVDKCWVPGFWVVLVVCVFFVLGAWRSW